MAAMNARNDKSAAVPAIVDANFFEHAQHTALRAPAQEPGVPLMIAGIAAPHDVARARIAARAAQGSGASEATVAVLATQTATPKPLTTDEPNYAVTAEPFCDAAARALCDGLAQRLRR
jgi:predicted kinase